MGLPDFESRKFLLMHHLEKVPRQFPLDYDWLAVELEGCNCADVVAFVEMLKEPSTSEKGR